MSLGNTYNNNQNNSKTPAVSVYSNYRMNNAESKIDATCITFRYWSNTLCISIFPRKNTGNDEIAFDMDNGITIYLSHTKARIFKHELEMFLRDPVTYNSVGVPSGQSVITISNGIEYGKDNPVITIRKINETGDVIASFAYEIKRNYHFSIRNYNDREKRYDTCYDDYQNIEIEQLITLLDEYVKASTNAVAFSVVDQQQRYSLNRMENKIDAIASELGVEVNRNGSGKRKYSSSTFFNNNSNSSSSGDYSSNVSYNSATIDDLE